MITRNPIGTPIDPDDHDFKGPRTPPTVAFSIEYRKGDVLLRQGVRTYGRLHELPLTRMEEMMNLLQKWLDDKLEELCET